MQGEPLSLAEEVAGVYDLHIAWADEAFFDELRHALGEMLPSEGALAERYAAFEKTLQVPPERVEPLALFATPIFAPTVVFRASARLRRRRKTLLAISGGLLDQLLPI